MTDSLILTLSYPPSVNHYWRHAHGKTYVSDQGHQYQLDTLIRVMDAGKPRMEGRLHLEVDVYPPDRRTRDLDNVGKSLLDAMKYSGVYADDEQIDRLTFTRRSIVKPGKVVVRISAITPELLENSLIPV